MHRRRIRGGDPDAGVLARCMGHAEPIGEERMMLTRRGPESRQAYWVKHLADRADVVCRQIEEGITPSLVHIALLRTAIDEYRRPSDTPTEE